MIQNPKVVGADEETLVWHELDHVMAGEYSPGLRVVALQAQGLVRLLWVDEVRPTPCAQGQQCGFIHDLEGRASSEIGD